MILIGIFADTKTTIQAFELFLSFQKYYWLCGPLLLTASVSFKETRWAIQFNKNRKNKIDGLYQILKNMNVQTIETGNVTAFYVEPFADVKGYVFLIYVGININRFTEIPPNDYKEILDNTVNKGYVLIYVPMDPSEDTETYTIKFETILSSFNKKYMLSKPTVFLMGRVNLDMPIMTIFFRNWECVSGLIWISIDRKKKTIKYLEKYVTGYSDSNMKRKKDIYILSIYERDSIENLNIWLSEESKT